MSSNAPTRFCLGVLALLWSAFQPASADVFEDLEVHGFVTQGFVKTSANNFFGDSQDGSFDFREMGINASLQATPSVRLTGQLLSRRAGEMSDGSLNVDFALADVSLFSTSKHRLDLLIGRVKNPLGFYNDTRDVAFTRSGVFLPQTIYFQSVRSLALSADGVAVKVGSFTDVGNIELQFGIGDPIIDENVEIAYLGGSYRGDYGPKGVSWVGRVKFETPDDRWRLALSAATTTLEFQPMPGDMMTRGETTIPYIIASAQYVGDKFTFTTEYVSEPARYAGFLGTPYHNQTPTLEGYYSQLDWRVAPKVEVLFRYEEGYIDKADRDGVAFNMATGLPAHLRFHKAYAFGARWDISPELMVRVEAQHTNGALTLSNRENPDPYAIGQHWDMFSVLASYRF